MSGSAAKGGKSMTTYGTDIGPDCYECGGTIYSYMKTTQPTWWLARCSSCHDETTFVVPQYHRVIEASLLRQMHTWECTDQARARAALTRDEVECDSCGNRTDDHVGSVCRPCHDKERRDDIALSQWKEKFRG